MISNDNTEEKETYSTSITFGEYISVNDSLCIEQISHISGNSIFYNVSPNKYLIPSHWSQDRVSNAIKSFLMILKPNSLIGNFLESIENSATRSQFAIHLESIMINLANLVESKINNQKKQVALLFRMLWAWDCLMWPSEFYQLLMKTEKIPNNHEWGPKAKIANEIYSLLPTEIPISKRSLLIRVLLNTNHVKEIGDLAPKIFNTHRYRPDTYWTLMTKCWAEILNKRYETKPPVVYQDFKYTGKKKFLRADICFEWVIETDASMEKWSNEARIFLDKYTEGAKHWVWAVNVLLKYLIEQKQATRNPIEYLSNEYPDSLRVNPETMDITPRLKANLSNRLATFMECILYRHCIENNTSGKAHIRAGFSNPYQRKKYPLWIQSETYRSALPRRLLRLAIEILTEDVVRDSNNNPLLDQTGQPIKQQFAWARTAFRQNHHGTDYFQSYNLETATWERIWSPVRACALLLKLLLPARTAQILAQESHECDSERPTKNGWIQNTHPLASTTVQKPNISVQRGALRKYTRKDGSIGSFIYFNTNKTGDRKNNQAQMGYVMPWEHKDAIDLYIYLEDWQRKFNPVTSPTKWIMIRDLEYRRSHKSLERRGSGTFLFRDPASGDGTPITHGKVEKLWCALLKEMQTRLAEAGETHADGTKITLIIEKDGERRSRRVLYDLHSLRVTGITLLYEEGVPLEMIRKIVGHSSVLMTLYYTKINGETITAKCDEAIARAMEVEQTNWAYSLPSLSHSELKNQIAFSDLESISQIKSANLYEIVVMPHGICPVGKSCCHIGLIGDAGDNERRSYSAVPGFSKNCARCRFFITGPMFLHGLVAYTNNKSYLLTEDSKEYEAAQNKMDQVENTIQKCKESGLPPPQSELLFRNRVDQIYQNAQQKVDESARNFSAAIILLNRVDEITKSRANNSNTNFSLVAPNGWANLTTEIHEVSEYSLIDEICQKAELFDGIQIDWQTASLKRLRLLERILISNGLEPRLTFFTDQEVCLQIGNELSRFLIAKLGAETTTALIDGRVTLKALGFEKEFNDKLLESTNHYHKFNAIQHNQYLNDTELKE